MGHVDHGKTTLLDYIRKTNIASREAGGITQTIGAYEITYKEEKITFIDTPGHEAFSNMRAYGARVADLAVLVVAADDGVKPQTKEALHAILDAKIPFVVAINKIDKNNADIERTKRDLYAAGIVLEGEGGNISWQQISAKTGEGVNELLDLILLAAEVEGLTYDPAAPASGVILMSRLDPRRGITAGVIVKDGTLRRGSLIATARANGRIKFLEDNVGKMADALVPSAPALVVGFEELPQVGELFIAGTDREVEIFLREHRADTKQELFKENTPAEEHAICLIVKADEMASLEALKFTVEQLKLPAPPRFISCGVGTITETDVKLAGSTKSLIVGFKTKIDKAAENLAKSQHTTIISAPVIYELGKKILEYAKKLVPKEMRRIEVLAIFGEQKGKERIIGGRVVLGPVKNQEHFEIWREEKQIGEGKIINLQSERKDILLAETNQEVGLLVQTNDSIKVGDFLFFDEGV